MKNALNAIVIDDDAINLEIITRALNKKNIVTRSFNNATDAYSCVNENHSTIDIIITDKMMTPMDGIELTSILKSNDNTSHIPVLIQSGDTRPVAIKEAYNMGVKYYLTKPFNSNELLDGVEHALK